MKAGPDRKHTVEFRDSAVRQVLDGARSEPQAARSLEMRGQPLAKRAPAQPVDDLQAECARLRQENARPRLEKEIVKKAAAYFSKESL